MRIFKTKIKFSVKNDQSYRPGYADALRGLLLKEKYVDTDLAPDGYERLKAYGFTLKEDIFDPIRLFCLIYGLRKRTVDAWCNPDDERFCEEFADVIEECRIAVWLRDGNRLMRCDKEDKFDDKLFEKRQWWVFKEDVRMPKKEEQETSTSAFSLDAIKQALGETE